MLHRKREKNATQILRHAELRLYNAGKLSESAPRKEQHALIRKMFAWNNICALK